MTPQHSHPEIDIEAQLRSIDAAGWADIPGLGTSNIWTSDRYVEIMGVDCAGDEWQKRVLNRDYVDSYLAYCKAGPSDQTWSHLVLWHKGRGRLMLCLSTAWWLPDNRTIQGVIHPLGIGKVLAAGISKLLAIGALGYTLGVAWPI